MEVESTGQNFEEGMSIPMPEICSSLNYDEFVVAGDINREENKTNVDGLIASLSGGWMTTHPVVCFLKK